MLTIASLKPGTITSDNGSEFSELTRVHDHVFYTDPYSPWKR